MRSIGNGSPVGHRLAAGLLNRMRPQTKNSVNVSDEKRASPLPTRSTVSQLTASAQTRSIPVPGRTARTSSGVSRPESASKSATNVSAQCSNGPGGSTGLAGKTSADQKSRQSGLPCRPTRSQAITGGRVLPPAGTTSRGDSSTGASAAEHTTCNSLPPPKTRVLSANRSTSGLVPPGSGSKVVRPPTRSLSRSQGGVKSGRLSAEPPRSRAGPADVDQTSHPSSAGTVASTGVRQPTDGTHGQTSTRSVLPPATVRQTTSKLVAPRASSASKAQQLRKPIPTNIPNVDAKPPTSDPSSSMKSASTGVPSVTSSDQHVTATSSMAVVRQLSVDSGSSSAFGAAAVAVGSQPDGARNSRGGGVESRVSEPSKQSSKMPRVSSPRQTSANSLTATAANRADQSAPSVDVAPCTDVTVTSSPEVVDSALSVAPMQPMTSRSYMTSGNPMMTSRLLSASQRPFTPLTGTWSGRQTLTNGYVSDGDVRPLDGTSSLLRHSGYLSEGGACRTRRLPVLHTMQQYLENVDDDNDR